MHDSKGPISQVNTLFSMADKNKFKIYGEFMKKSQKYI